MRIRLTNKTAWKDSEADSRQTRRSPQGILLYFQGLERSISPNLPAKTGRSSCPLSLRVMAINDRYSETIFRNIKRKQKNELKTKQIKFTDESCDKKKES